MMLCAKLFRNASRFPPAQTKQEGCLSLWFCVPKGDLGNPKRTTWAVRTDELLSKDTCDHNVVIRPIKYVDFTGL